MRIQPIGVIGDKLALEGAASSSPVKSFQELLKKGIEHVDALQKRSDGLMQAYAAGETANIHEVMIAATEANLALQLTVAIRNQALQAYQEIMRMQV